MRGRVLLYLSMFLFISCSAKPVEVIYISTPCIVDMPKRPTDKMDTFLNTVEILKYVELLEESLKLCRGD